MTAGGGKVRRTAVRAASPGSFSARLTEISMFFDGRDAVHNTMRTVAAALDREGIAYAILGGMAVNAHRHSRTTKDVDLLLAAEGFAAFKAACRGG